MSEIDRLWTQAASLADFQDREKIYRKIASLCGENFAEQVRAQFELALLRDKLKWQ